MDIKDAKEIAELLNQQGDMNYIDGATEEQISTFEKEKEFKLPTKFKEWLLFSDGGNIFLPAGLQLYGVGHKPIINVEDKDKPSDDYIVIGRMAWGEPIVFKKGEEEIAIYDHEAGEIDNDARYEDFYAFMKGLYDLLGIGE